MKSLKESLFDDDLVTKSFPIDRNTLVSLCEKVLQSYSKHMLWNKNSSGSRWELHNDGMMVWIKKGFQVNSNWAVYIKVRVLIPLKKEGFISVPYIELCLYPLSGGFSNSLSDGSVAARWIAKKYGDKVNLNPHTCLFTCDSNNVDTTIDIVMRILNFFTTQKGEDMIQKEIDMFYKNNEKNIPGIVLDQVFMKKAINSL